MKAWRTFKSDWHNGYTMVTLYTYPARVLKVVDGDTFDARIDVGFGIGLNDRLRLKGIDAPEITTAEGRLAKSFLTDQLTPCPQIILRTTREEKFGRWLADVFILKGETAPRRIAAEGEYLNQLLLDEGLAEVYQ